jgi:phosphoketolase
MPTGEQQTIFQHEAMHRVARLRSRSAAIINRFNKKLLQYSEYIRVDFEDMPEITDWKSTNRVDE